jgi:hypothetical protein
MRSFAFQEDWLEALFASLIIRTFQFVFSVGTIFFSYSKLVNSTFSHDFSAKTNRLDTPSKRCRLHQRGGVTQEARDPAAPGCPKSGSSPIS